MASGLKAALVFSLIGFNIFLCNAKQIADIVNDPSNGSGIVYMSEGTSTALLWKYYVPVVAEITEISLTLNERHAVRFFRIGSSPHETTNFTAVYPPFPNEAFVNDMENMTVGLRFSSVNISMSGNWTLAITYSNIATPAIKNNIVLYVVAPPHSVHIQSSYRYPLVRSLLEIHCSASSSGPSFLSNYAQPITFKWFHNGMALGKDLLPAPMRMKNQTWISKLLVQSVSEAHAGSYACRAEELSMSTVSSTIRIKPIGFPAVVQSPYPAVSGERMMLSCQPQIPVGLGAECSSLHVRLTCNGRQLQALTFPTPGNDSDISSKSNSSTPASVDYRFDSVTSDLNAVDCLCIVKYNRKAVFKMAEDKSFEMKAAASRSIDELLSTSRLLILYPPADVQLSAEPPMPWLLPSRGELIKSNTSNLKFRLKCSVGVAGNPKNIRFSWPSEQPAPDPTILIQPNSWSMLLDFSDSLNASMDNDRVVQCRPSNDAGDGPIAERRIVVYTNPEVSVKIPTTGEIIRNSQEIEIQEGSSISFHCSVEVSGATPSPSLFFWRRDGILLSTTSQDLELHSLRANQAGRYQCEVAVDTKTATIGVLTSSSSFKLSVVYINLTVDALKQSEVVGEGDNVTLVCKADGYPVTAIKFQSWVFEPKLLENNEPLPSRTIPIEESPFSMDEELNNLFLLSSEVDTDVPPVTMLHLTNVEPTDSGKYWCSASNRATLTKRRFISLDIHFKPRLNQALSSLSSIAVRVGKPVVLLAALSSNPQPEEFEFFRLNGPNAIPNPLPPSWIVERMSANVMQLHIPSLSPNELLNGPVTVAAKARNSRGQSTFYFTLSARGPPSDPTDLKVLRLWPTSLLIGFKPGFDGGQPQQFIIFCSPQDHSSKKSVNMTIADPGFGKYGRIFIENLEPATSYRCSVQGRVVQNGSSSNFWQTSIISVIANTMSMPTINFTKVDWSLSTPRHKNTSMKRYFLEKICVSVSCQFDSEQCNSQTGKFLKESRRHFVVNLAGMRLAAEITLCSRRRELLCWTSATNHTLQVWQSSVNSNESAVSPSELCFERFPKNLTGLENFQSIPDFHSSVLASVRLFSIMDGDFVAERQNEIITSPSRRQQSSRFFDIFDDSTFDDYDFGAEISSGLTNWLLPISGTVIGIILVIGFIALVAVLSCSAARRAKRSRQSQSQGRRRPSMSPTDSNISDPRVTTTGVFTLSTTPSSSPDHFNNQHVPPVKKNPVQPARHNGGHSNTMGAVADENNSKKFNRDGAARSSDFHWADFRQNPLLSSVGVASTLTAGALSNRRDERVVTCLSSSKGDKIERSDQLLAAQTLQHYIKPQNIMINSVPEIGDFDFGDVNPKEHQRRTSDSDGTKSTDGSDSKPQLDEQVTPPPRYATLYSRLAEFKGPVRSQTSSNCANQQQQQQIEYAKLDFIKMANYRPQTMVDAGKCRKIKVISSSQNAEYIPANN